MEHILCLGYLLVFIVVTVYSFPVQNSNITNSFLKLHDVSLMDVSDVVWTPIASTLLQSSRYTVCMSDYGRVAGAAANGEKMIYYSSDYGVTWAYSSGSSAPWWYTY